MPSVIVEPADEAGRTVFDASEIKTYALTVAREDLAKIDANPRAEKYVPAKLEVGAESLRVGLRYKGSMGAFMPPCTTGMSEGPKLNKCSLKVAFDEYDQDARFHGLKKLNLHAMNMDPSMMLEHLAYGLFREMGLAASRTSYVRVTINGKLEGLFLAVEEIDGRFTRTRFPGDGEGNVYKEVWPVDGDPKRYLSALETNKEAADVDGMLAFAGAIRDDPSSAVTKFLDRDYVLRYLAVDRVIMNDDGPFHLYCLTESQTVFYNHNFFWYESAQSQRMWLLPWDLDVAMGATMVTLIEPPWWERVNDCTCRLGPSGLRTLPSSCEPVIGVFAGWKADYDAMVDRFLAGPFSKARVDAKFAAWTEQLAPQVAEAAGARRAPTPEGWRAGIERLRRSIDSLRLHRGHKYP